MTTGRRFLFSTTSGHGHLNPLIPLARALRARGHEVAFAARDFVQPRIQTAGFRFFPVGSDFNLDPEYRAFKEIQETMPLSIESELVIYTKLFAGIAPRLMSSGLVEVGQTWQPHVIIREAGEYGALIAAEYLSLPHVVVSFAAALGSVMMLESSAAQGLDSIRQVWGLPPDPDLTAMYRYLHLVYSPPAFALQDVTGNSPSFPVPPNTHFIRPQIFDNTADETLPEWVAALPDQPTVYITMGTEVNKMPELYPSVLGTIIKGLRDAPYNLIVTLGRGKDPADFGGQPPNVHIVEYIPQSLLLPHVDLMVMHGGSNSLLAALDVGLPLVIIPFIADQFFNAHVTETVGLGRAIAHDDLTPSAVRAVVEDVLHNPAYRETARRLQVEMHHLPDQNRAVELVEQLVVESP